MVGASPCFRTVSCVGGLKVTDRANVAHRIPTALRYSTYSSSLRLSFQLGLWRGRGPPSKSILVGCKSSRRFDDNSSDPGEEPDGEYLEAFVLISETIRHYRMQMQGFQELKWQSSTQLVPFSVHANESKTDVSSIGLAFLRRFLSPTIFLKISCDGDFLLPIIVGEFAVEKLIESSTEDESWDCPNQFQLVGNLVEKLGYRVTMVKITKRVVNTYFARILLCKPGEKGFLSIDARPSDAINVARRCRAPIYVNKQIVLMDGIRIAYGTGRIRDAKPVYDVSLDSASDGPDLLSEELDLVMNMNLAVKEERYGDAAMWRDKLMKLLESRHGH
ncbi:hypothetical protein NMG60_11007793 [Bertholletia excelsa]